MIIGLSAKIGAGKDTVGKIIQFLTMQSRTAIDGNWEVCLHWCKEYLNNEREIVANVWEIKKFASKLKEIVAILTGCTVEDLESQEFKDKELSKEWWTYKVFPFDIDTPKFIPIQKSIQDLTSDEFDELERYKRVRKPTYRLLLQLIGTECMRDVVGSNTWVNALFSNYRPSLYYMCDRCMNDNIISLTGEGFCPDCRGKESEGDITKVMTDNCNRWIITDMRFPNELKAVKDRGGISIRINRPKDVPGIDSESFKMNMGTGEIVNEHPSETALDTYKFDYTIDNNGTIDELIVKVKEILIKEVII